MTRCPVIDTRVPADDYPPAERPQVVYLPQADTPAHERVVHGELARRIAVLCGWDSAAPGAPAREGGPPRYIVPAATLDDPAEAARLGIRGETDLFGGVVPHPFVATKIITHDLVDDHAGAIAGWSGEFARRVAPVVLNGYSVFSRADARRAGERLLKDGEVRLKPACARGGRGQTVVRTAAELEHALAAMEESELAEGGLVLEENLEDVVTFSVGQLRLPGFVASYSGTQSLAPDNRGEMVYGGSELHVVAGDFERLLALELPPDVHRAVEHAWRYDQAASECYAGFFASRRNYDVVQGRDARGELRCGVLEQSWRIGGASGAEVAALEVLMQGDVDAVSASVVERYGQDVSVPEGARVLFQDNDRAVGPVTKYTVVKAYGNAE